MLRCAGTGALVYLESKILKCLTLIGRDQSRTSPRQLVLYKLSRSLDSNLAVNVGTATLLTSPQVACLARDRLSTRSKASVLVVIGFETCVESVALQAHDHILFLFSDTR